jgi:malate permease and related proteins
LYIHKLTLSGDIVLVMMMAWICFAVAVGFFWLLGRYRKLSRATVGSLILTGGMGNTAFFGLPMIEAYYGQQSMGTGILIDQTGSFLVLSTVGIIVAGIYSSGRPSGASILLSILRFPPFIALVVALLLLPVEYPDWLTSVLTRLGDTLAPLALLSVGLQLRLGQLWENCCNLSIGLFYKLVFAPFFIFVLYVVLIGAKGEVMQVTIFEAAMPPMITAAILAKEHNLDVELATLMVAVGLPLSFVTLSAWWWLLQGI